MRHVRPTLVVAAAALCVAALAPRAGSAVKEPETGIRFEESMKPEGATRALSLMGLGPREKTMFYVNVYAVAYYVASGEAKEALSDWKGESGEQLRRKDAVLEQLLAGEHEQFLRLVMARDVDGEDMADAFDESLGPRVERYGGAEAKKALKTFRGYFDVDEVSEGTTIDFVWRSDGKLVTSIDGERAGSLSSKGLSKALFSLYLGDDAVSSPAKKSFYEGLSELLGS